MVLTGEGETKAASAAVAPPLDAVELYRFYPAGDEQVFALRGTSLRLERGEFVAVVGPSGSGKSTLLACLAGLDEPDGGTVRLGGQRMSRQPERIRARLRATHLGIVFQDGNLLAHLTVAQNVAFAHRISGRTRADALWRSELLGRLSLSARSHAVPTTLSGGELARAGLAVALANEPPVLIADEPTAELDGENEDAVLELLQSECARGTSAVVATHSDSVAAAADRVVQLVDGRIQG